MKIPIYMILLLVNVIFCTSKTSNEVKPTDEQIEEYLQKMESEKKQSEAGNTKKKQNEAMVTRKIVDLLFEREHIIDRIARKEAEIQRERRRFIRKYNIDSLMKWTSENEHDEVRITNIDKQLAELGYTGGIPGSSSGIR